MIYNLVRKLSEDKEDVLASREKVCFGKILKLASAFHARPPSIYHPLSYIYIVSCANSSKQYISLLDHMIRSLSS